MTTPTNTNKRLGVKTKGVPKAEQQATVDHNDTLRKLFGTDRQVIVDGLLRHCFKMLEDNESSDEYSGNDERAFLIAIIAEIKPRDGVERMLAVQMAATHVAMVRVGQWLARSTNLPQAQTHTNGYTKLARTYATQMEALRKHRNGGKQTVVVQHVNVEDGGQAIVGAVQCD
jgi:hypothetical protein